MQSYFPVVDVIRFLSAFFVVLYHFTFNNGHHSRIPDYFITIFDGWFDYGLLSKIASMGWIGVDFFFVISGFVISGSIRKGAKKFIIARYMRLFPTLYFFSTIAFLVTLIFGDIGFLDAFLMWLKSIVLFPVGPWIDGVYWSLIVEILFYLLILFFWIIFKENGIFALMISLTLLSSLGCFSLLISVIFGWDDVILFLSSYQARLLLITTGSAFSLGMVLKLISQKGFQLKYLLVGLINFSLTLIWIFNQSLSYTTILPSIYLVGFSIFILILLILDVFINFNYSKTFLKLSMFFGRQTYPIYLFHNITGSLILVGLVNLGYGQWLSLILSLIIVFAVSIIFTFKLEGYINKLIATTLQSALNLKLKSNKFS